MTPQSGRFFQEYRIKANEEENNHVIGMTPEARLELIRYANSVLKQARHKPDPFEARHGEGAIRFALICHLFRHVEVEQRGLGRTYGVKPGSLFGHEIDLDIESARAGIEIQKWFVRRQIEFLAPKRIQDQDAIWDKFHERMKSRPRFTARGLYASSQGLTAAAANTLFSQWVSKGWIEPIASSKKPPGPGRPPSQEYRLVPIFRKL